ncbi:hypothetical protein QUF74_18335 [Candidatus Halobeggiatoa sp. HSG11]|nr:hypothetical protein [Candidatus Halobeggiatoa sp. HSG11]
MRFILIFTVFLLSSCSIVEDPNQSGGLVSTATNIAAGSYDERLQKRQEILDDAQAKKQQLEEENQQLETEKLTLSQQREVETQKLQVTAANIKQLEKKLKGEKSTLKSNKKSKSKQLRRLKELKSRNKKLQQRINTSNNDDAIKAVQEERDRLDKELSLLLEAAQ